MYGFSYYPEAPRPYSAGYKCYSVSMLPGNELRQDVDNGGKIILPPSALEVLTRHNVTYPMLFKIFSYETSRETHCGVLEFVAEEGKCYIPYWMMRNLMIEEGSGVRVESAELQVATYSKFQPQSVEFLDITNPKAMLENALRSFACLTTGDMIAIKYNDRSYELRVLETKPGPAVSIIECDMDVEFSAPADYVEPKKEDVMDTKVDDEKLADYKEPGQFTLFSGRGNRLDGKEATTSPPGASGPPRRGIPDPDWKFGSLTFFRPQPKEKEETKESKPFEPFTGEGTTLRGSKQ